MEPKLLGIPLEIRLMIYDELLVDTHRVGAHFPRRFGLEDWKSGPRKRLEQGIGLLFVCKQISAEARTTLYKKNRFYFDDYPGQFNIADFYNPFLPYRIESGRNIQHIAISIPSVLYCYYPTEHSAMLLKQGKITGVSAQGEDVGRIIRFLSYGHRLKTLEIVFSDSIDLTECKLWAHFFRNPAESRLLQTILNLRGVRFLCHDTIIKEWTESGDLIPSQPLLRYQTPLEIMRRIARTIAQPGSMSDLEMDIELHDEESFEMESNLHIGRSSLTERPTSGITPFERKHYKLLMAGDIFPSKKKWIDYYYDPLSTQDFTPPLKGEFSGGAFPEFESHDDGDLRMDLNMGCSRATEHIISDLTLFKENDALQEDPDFDPLVEDWKGSVGWIAHPRRTVPLEERFDGNIRPTHPSFLPVSEHQSSTSPPENPPYDTCPYIPDFNFILSTLSENPNRSNTPEYPSSPPHLKKANQPTSPSESYHDYDACTNIPDFNFIPDTPSSEGSESSDVISNYRPLHTPAHRTKSPQSSCLIKTETSTFASILPLTFPKWSLKLTGLVSGKFLG